jgi:hypothetical protein
MMNRMEEKCIKTFVPKPEWNWQLKIFGMITLKGIMDM